MNDGWFSRAVDRLGFHVVMGWLIVCGGLGIMFDSGLLLLIGLFPLVSLMVMAVCSMTVEWLVETVAYIRDGDEEEEDV